MTPTIVYKLALPTEGGSHRGPKGRFYRYKGVKTEDELKEALETGWHESLPVAVGLEDAPEVQKPKKRQPQKRVVKKEAVTERKKFGEE